MKRSLWLSGAATALALVIGAGVVLDRPTPALAQDKPLDRAQVEQIVREYLLANPELMVEMQSQLEQKQQAQAQAAAQTTIAESKADIFDSAHDGIVGNPNGKTTVVEFFDYNCGYCRHALSDMQALTKEDGDLRFVLKELPILGPDSQKAHMVSMAFRKLMPEKYSEFHQKLLGQEGRAGEASAIQVATSLGADEAKLREEMKDPEIGEVFQKTYDLANRLNVSGTPSYVIGDEMIYGAQGADALREKIAALRSDASSN
ncbi:DsbA family protein [Mesorhizobium sp. RP14(2022)]|uniref:DsbA family protein n=1 Tax=Mesorhizobium liriopis TaxID=2953882 RepID=A0ABT1CB74_9HYPH|nr:DsbA family protein [Mesorhizobium liriopis]MCO6052060.1 DsbA family protein [Mesorhizobium liriopis]